MTGITPLGLISLQSLFSGNQSYIKVNTMLDDGGFSGDGKRQGYSPGNYLVHYWVLDWAHIHVGSCHWLRVPSMLYNPWALGLGHYTP